MSIPHYSYDVYMYVSPLITRDTHDVIQPAGGQADEIAEGVSVPDIHITTM